MLRSTEMKQNFFSSLLLVCVWGMLWGADSATAQVTADGTTSTTVNVEGNNFEINNGDRAGGNLFHSFDEFSVPNGGEAFFNNTTDISNIFSRVTGGNISNIDGLIRANGSASLFLINPAGIIFGQGARLDIGGSFYGSSADSILFPDDVSFSASDLNPPLLTINAPIGLSFRDNPGDIINRSDLKATETLNEGTESEFTEINPIGLEVDKGRNIALIGGDIGIIDSAITAPGGRVTLGGLSQAGIVSFNADSSFIFPDNIEKTNVSLINSNFFSSIEIGIFDGNPFLLSDIDRTTKIDVRADVGGFIDINARELILKGALLQLGINEGLSDAVAGDIKLTANSISLEEHSIVSSSISNGEGTIGDINFTADSISLNDSIVSSSISNGEGTIEDINFTADSISLDFSIISSSISNGEGTIGDINFTTDSISLDFSIISSSISNGEGTIGDIDFTADSISLNDNSSIISLTTNDGEGTIGDIDFTADSISISNRSDIITSSETSSNASDIQINATELIEINGIGSSISSETGGLGNAGNIKIDTPELKILDNAQISANNFIIETFEISPFGGLIRNILEQPIEASGNAGEISITANNITLEERGGITALSSAGEGGNIQLKVNNLLSLRNNSEISTTAGVEVTPGNGGNINIDSTFIVAFPNGNNDITANAFDGTGGNITIFTEGVFGIEARSSTPANNTNDIDASGETDGIIEIITPDVNPIQRDTDLPSNLFEGLQTTAQACNPSRKTSSISNLTVKGKGGVPAEPGLPLNSLNITVNGENNPTSTIPAPMDTAQGKIQPARGIKVTESGEVILTAYLTNNSGDRIPETRNCG